MKILVVRNDKLGDFMLSLPSFAMLKLNMPDAKIYALVPEYTAAIAKYSPYIDKVIIDTTLQNNALSSMLNLRQLIKKENFNAVITLYTTARVGLACFLSSIPYRLSPGTKIAQIFYNKRLIQKRSLSEKPEFEYNKDLVKKFLLEHGHRNISEPQPPFLSFPEQEIESIKQQIHTDFSIPAKNKIIIIHPGSGGSATNLSIQQYATLSKILSPPEHVTLLITSGPGEEEIASNLAAQIPELDYRIYISKQGLLNFCKVISISDLFISGSTGPLHISGALNNNTVAFYPIRRSATSLRWQTLNHEQNRLAISPLIDKGELELADIDLVIAASKIREKFSAIFG